MRSLFVKLIFYFYFLQVDNGEGAILARFEPDDFNFCDGEWRTITAIKSLYVITIQVNGVASEPSIGSATSPSTDTSRPLFFGGHPYMQRVSFYFFFLDFLMKFN